MACEGNGMSDERIGKALIKEVIEEELKDVPSEEVLPLTPLLSEEKTEQEEKVVNQLSKMIRIVGDRLQGDQTFQDAIDGFQRGSGFSSEKFKQVAEKVLEHGITWEKIAVLFYVAGKLAAKVVEAHLPQMVKDILKWTVEFFKKNLLGWIRDHGGWINSFSELAVGSVQSMTSMNSYKCSLVLIFVAGLALGSIITLKCTQRL